MSLGNPRVFWKHVKQHSSRVGSGEPHLPTPNNQNQPDKYTNTENDISSQCSSSNTNNNTMTSSSPSSSCTTCHRYTPTVSSPLNPKHTVDRRRSNSNSQKPLRRPRPRTRVIDLNLAQRLLRHKAAEAWRDHVLASQFDEWAMLEGCCIEQVRTSTSTKPKPSLLPLHIIIEEEEDDDVADTGAQQHDVGKEDSTSTKNGGLGFSLLHCLEKGQMFAMPDMSALMTRRMILAMGLVGVLPALRVRSYLRPALAI